MTAVSHGRSGRPWRELRAKVLREQPYCEIRGPKCKGIATTVDHRVPLSVAPELAHERSNLRSACGPCNYAGGARITNAKRSGSRVQDERQPYTSPRFPVCVCKVYCVAREAGSTPPGDCYGITARRL